MFHIEVPFAGEWPALAPFRIRLSEGAEGTTPQAAFQNGILEVALAKADVVRATLSSLFPDGRLEDFAIWHWMSNAATAPQPGQIDDLAKAARAGRHWMFTPYRKVTFTHAVQQPLAVPDMTKVIPTRVLGATYTDFEGSIVNHAKSTGRIDVPAEWTEDVDLVTNPEPRMAALGNAVPHSAHAFGFDLMPDEDQAEVTRADVGRISRQEFGDTKYRRITYHGVATTRFREFLPAVIANDPAKIQQVEQKQAPDGKTKPLLVHDVPSSARPAHADVMYSIPTFRWERNDEGSIRTHIRHGGGIRLWLRRPWFSSGDGEQLGVLLEPGIRLPPGWMRSPALEQSLGELAARPPLVSSEPLLRGVPAPIRQPAHSSVRSLTVSSSAQSRRLSGVGRASRAALAGAFPQPTATDLRRMLAPYVTMWGTDPIWDSAAPDQPPTVAAFPDHVSYATGLTLDEISPYARVTVAGHEVHWDKDRGLWYCDITVDAGDSYYPFVRLALARFQPHSVIDAHLSRVTVADFMQLVPNRTARVEIGSGSADITVTGFSGTNSAVSAEFPPREKPVVQPNTTMQVALQRRRASIPGDLGWERLNEITLEANFNGFNVVWSGSVALPEGALETHQHRLLITEIETFFRDQSDDDPAVITSPFLRERVVYADAFEL